jgi:hypothetical protein
MEPTLRARAVDAGPGERRGSRGLLLGACLVLALLWPWAGPVAPARAANVIVDVESGVDPSAVMVTNKAVEATQAYFAKVFDLTLDHDVRIKLTADKEDFIDALVHEARNAPVVAAKQAEQATGVSKNNTIVEHLGRKNDPARVAFLVGHELTHQYQEQASKTKHHPVLWITEGSADCIAGQIVERMGLGSLDALRRQWLKQVKAVSDKPRLANLRTWSDWSAAKDRYGPGLVYRMGDVAVCELIEQKGAAILFDYFKHLRTMPAKQAFEETFGLSMDTFELRAEDQM